MISNTAKNIMVLGTASSVGKSIVTAGLCRIFLEDGWRVAPFKSQNMSLNSFVTKEGLEMGRAQAVQAEACGIEPSVIMNPILIKPTSEKKAQVIINGRVFKNFDAWEYHNYKSDAKDIAFKAYYDLEKNYDIIVLEGAGSPVEINLRERDIVNMGMAEIANAPVVLVADIDRGGVFASIVGTIQLLSDDEKKRVKGIIINKFRGEIGILKSGLKMLEDIVNIPVLGVIPYIKIDLEDEDSVTERFKMNETGGEIEIKILRLPHISNFSDFNVFRIFKDVNVNYIDLQDDFSDADIVIIPGSKNTMDDLRLIKNNGIDKKIIQHYKSGKLVIGICSGFQILGKSVEDPFGIEDNVNKIDGIGLINMVTTLYKEKVTTQVKGNIAVNDGILKGLTGYEIEGYEIHMGRSLGPDLERQETVFVNKEGNRDGFYADNIIGTYIHGIFDSVDFTRGLLNNIRERKGALPLYNSGTFKQMKDSEFKKLARTMRENLDMEKIYEILNNSRA